MSTGLFPPPKRPGLALHGLLVLVLAAISAWGFWRLSATEVSPSFVVYLLIGLLAFAPIPLLGYRAYALHRAQYRLDRNTLQLKWGLRDEIIVLGDIEWVRPAEDLTHPLAAPTLPLPGAVLGLVRHRDLGIVEFIASRRRNLLLIKTPQRVFAISPEEPVAFMGTFARAVELGSLTGIEARSQYPSFVFAQAWRSGLVRFLWLSTLFFNLGLAAWISYLVPSSPTFALGYRPDRSPEAVPSSQLIILPLVSALLCLIGWIAGLFFHRQERRQILSIILWGAGALASIFFLLAALFIVLTPL